MTAQLSRFPSARPLTAALERKMRGASDERIIEDLLYLEHWELYPLPGPAAALRVSQLRRANPELAADIRHELTAARQRKRMNV